MANVYRRCYICDRRFRLQNLFRIDREEDIVKSQIAIGRRDVFNRPPLEITNLTRLCINCNQSIIEEINIIENDPQCLRLNVLTQTRNSTCFLCNAENNLIRLSIHCKARVFIRQNIYIPTSVRSCLNHLDEKGYILAHFLPQIRFLNRPYIIRGEDLNNLLQAVRNVANSTIRLEDEESFSDEEFECLSPITKEQFRNLFTFCNRVQVPDGYRYISRRDLLMFLCKMRQGLSDSFLNVLFQYGSRQNVSMVISIVRRSLMEQFVPNNIGFEAITREDYIARHVTPFANALYNPQPEVPRAIVAIDGTYTFIPKSTNFRALRQSYCVHKGRHLVKPHMMVAMDGYILDIQGPYFSDSRNNDASILQNEFEGDDQRMRNWFVDNDIAILDSGYRDVRGFLENQGLACKMTVALQRGQRQLNTEEANESRLVTKSRWIVEARNGHIKSIFKFMNNIMQIQHVYHLGDFYKIAGAIINRYHPLITMADADIVLARRLLEKAEEPNVVQALVELDNLQNRNAQRWLRLNAVDLNDFPILDLEYLRNFTFGTYQIQLSASYVQDKVQRENDEVFQIEVLLNENRIPEPGFIRVRVYSRFRNAGRYHLWIAYISNEQREQEADEEPILGHYCTCKSGARTVGSCAHVTSVLWYLGYARHEENVHYPSTALIETVNDAGNR